MEIEEEDKGNWYSGGRNKHMKVCKALARWIKNNSPDAIVALRLQSYRHKNNLHHLSPDLDVVAIDGRVLKGFEVKLFAMRKAGLTERLLKRRERVLASLDSEIYSGIGQALLLLRYVDKAYLVLPALRIENRYTDLVNGDAAYVLEKLFREHLPIGLIYFDQELRFWTEEEAKEACCLGFHRQSLIQAIKDHRLC